MKEQWYHPLVPQIDILPALQREDSSVGGSATDPRRQLAGSCALLWDFREGVVSPPTRGRPTRIARAVPSSAVEYCWSASSPP